MDIDASFEADVMVSTTTEAESEAGAQSANLMLILRVNRLSTRLECKLALDQLEDGEAVAILNDGIDGVHVRQTGHVVAEADLDAVEAEPVSVSADLVAKTRDLLTDAIVNSLKNVDCDLPPLGDLCSGTEVCNLNIKLKYQHLRTSSKNQKLNT